jgi:hypothetical protein
MSTFLNHDLNVHGSSISSGVRACRLLCTCSATEQLPVLELAICLPAPLALNVQHCGAVGVFLVRIEGVFGKTGFCTMTTLLFSKPFSLGIEILRFLVLSTYRARDEQTHAC